jgi:glycosyltransferase involved in cell wall biosynthesis
VTSLRERSLARTARRLVFQTEFDREDFVRRHPIDERRTSVVPNSIDASWFDPAQRDANRSSRLHRIIFVGTLNRRKGVMVLLDAFSRLVGKGIDISLDVIGSGPLEAQIRKLVERDGLNDRVFLHGPKPGAVSLIAQADLLAVPSLYDSFPNVLLEALHTGTPALGTRAGGIPEILAADELLVPPGDPATLAAAIERLVRDPDAYRKAKQLVAKRRATFEFDWVGRFEAELEYSLSHSRP